MSCSTPRSSYYFKCNLKDVEGFAGDDIFTINVTDLEIIVIVSVRVIVIVSEPVIPS